MSLGLLIESTVAQHTHDGVVDVTAVAASFGCEVVMKFKNSTLKGAIRPCSSENKLAEIALNVKNDNATNRTLIALLLAEHLLNLVHRRSKKVTIDTFFLSEIRNYKMSASVMIGTRIAMPREIIDSIDCPLFNALDYASEAELMPSFVSSTLKMSNSWLVNTIHGSVIPQLLKIIKIRSQSDLKLASLI
jgi:hypothetical protein